MLKAPSKLRMRHVPIVERHLYRLTLDYSYSVIRGERRAPLGRESYCLWKVLRRGVVRESWQTIGGDTLPCSRYILRTATWERGYRKILDSTHASPNQRRAAHKYHYSVHFNKERYL